VSLRGTTGRRADVPGGFLGGVGISASLLRPQVHVVEDRVGLVRAPGHGRVALAHEVGDPCAKVGSSRKAWSDDG
jgi:hypothetical protein